MPLNATAGLVWGDLVRITSKSAVNVRKGPGTEYGLVGEAMSTNTYPYLGGENDWYQIQFTSNEVGWVPAKYTGVEIGLVWDVWAEDEVEAVARNTHSNALNVRSGPGKDYKVIGQIDPDTVWTYCGTENGWNRIIYGNGYAFVAANRTTIEVIGEIDAVSGATGETADCEVCQNTRICPTCGGKRYVYSAIEGDNVDCPTCCGLGVCYACIDNR